MTTCALIWILLASALHVSWNAVVAGQKAPVGFLFRMLVTSSLLLSGLLPPLWLALGRPPLGLSVPVYMALAISGPVQAVYQMLICLAYMRSHLSAVYPTSRGLAPVLIALISHLLFGETIRRLGYLGIALVLLGILLLHAPGLGFGALCRAWRGLGRGSTALAAAAAFMIALYHLADRQGALRANPLGYAYLLTLSNTAAYGVLLCAVRLMSRGGKELALGNRDEPGGVGATWARGIWIGLVLFLSYFIVLWLMHDPSLKLAYLAAARNISVVLGAAYGTLARGEGTPGLRLLGAAIVFGGVVAITLAR